MKIYSFLRLWILGCLMLAPALAWSVTQKEMEQARTIAAKAYLRYANDGSGYLDDLNPTTIEELEGVIKPKEKENLKAFKAIAVPADYKDWNKEKLMEYWAVTAFQDKGLLEKGRGGRIRARSLINKMTIAPPAPQPAVAPVAAATPTAMPAAEAAAAEEISQLDSLAQADNADELLDETLDVDRATNYTWVYIMILAILVAIVVALVVYAASVFKKTGNQNKNGNSSSDKDLREASEHYESVISDKNVEIAMLNKKIETLSRQNSELKAKLDAINAEMISQKAMATRQRGLSQVKSENPEPGVKRQPQATQGSSPKSNLRSIYLGRANSRGIFVRADRTLNPGNSVFILDTSDGFSGSFRVADSQEAWDLALSNPREYLETACTGHDLEDTEGIDRIVTESSGTAIFEGGCWRVIRKARIRYEE